MMSYFIYIFLIIPVFLLPYGFYKYYHQENIVVPFSAISVRSADKMHLETLAIIMGQFTTKGEGFFVGKKVAISFMLYLKNKDEYNNMKTMAQFVPVNNAIEPKAYRRDIQSQIRNGDFEGSFLNPGLLKLTKTIDDKQILIYEGEVIFKKEGDFKFGLPLEAIMINYRMKIDDINIAPAHVKYVIDANKIALLLSFVSASVASLSLFLGSLSFIKKY